MGSIFSLNNSKARSELKEKTPPNIITEIRSPIGKLNTTGSPVSAKKKDISIDEGISNKNRDIKNENPKA
jgi:hypothetical protein